MAPAADPNTTSSSFPQPQHPPKPFRFKRKRSPSPSASEFLPKKHSTYSDTTHHSSYRHHHHRHHHRRSRRRPHTPTDNNPPFNDDDTHLDPETAFRESLFDALADDEGASYWEGVYGQPIHTYSPFYDKQRPEDEDPDPENPKLERMTDEEYVSYVRGKMWEKSHQFVVEERKKRELEWKRRREREEEGRRWRAGVDEALRRGEERRRKGRWKDLWGRYVNGWEKLRWDELGGGGMELRERIRWPVESGKWEDVGKEEVERFFRSAPSAVHGDNCTEVSLRSILKKERVRWHPDKMQQKAGAVGMDVGTLKIVTAVFQVVDRLWSEMKGDS